MFTLNQINDMKTAEIVQLHNRFATKPVKRFSDRTKAVLRTVKVLKESGEMTNGMIKPQLVAKPEVKKPEVKKQKAADTTFNYDRKELIKDHREGTKRAQVILMLKEGTTLEKVMSTIGWDRRTARDGIRLVHTLLGYGLKNVDGTITLVE